METSEQIAGLVERSLECNFRGQWDLHVPDSHFSAWRSFPTPMVSLMLDGELELEIRTRTARTVQWRKGEVICVLPEMSRRRAPGAGGDVRYCGAAATFEVLRGLDPLSLFELPVVFSGREAGRLGATLLALRDVAGITDPLKCAMTRKCLCGDLLVQLLEPAKPRGDAAQRLRGFDRISKALKHLMDNYASAPDIARLAGMACLSISRFHTVFKQAVGCPPHVFARRCRLDKAALLLAAGDLPVAQVGLEVGWEDQFHFSRTFKAFFGVPPKAYREKAKAGLLSL